MPPNARMLVAGTPTTPAGGGLPADFSAAHSTSRRQALKLVIGVGLPCLLHGRSAAAATADMRSSPEELAPGGEAEVSEIIDGDTLRLDDGREVRLVGTQAPKLPLGRPNFPTWPLAEEA